jgi:hypothetical protein
MPCAHESGLAGLERRCLAEQRACGSTHGSARAGTDQAVRDLLFTGVGIGGAGREQECGGNRGGNDDANFMR